MGKRCLLPSVLFVSFDPKTFMELQHVQRLLLKGRANHCVHQIFIQDNLQYELYKGCFYTVGSVLKCVWGDWWWGCISWEHAWELPNTFSVGCLDFSFLYGLSLSNLYLLVFTGCDTLLWMKLYCSVILYVNSTSMIKVRWFSEILIMLRCLLHFSNAINQIMVTAMKNVCTDMSYYSSDEIHADPYSVNIMFYAC